MRRVWVIVALLAVSGASAAPEEENAGGETDQARAQITYLTSSTAYVDAGSNDGVAVGDRMEVVRGDAVVAVLTVTAVSGSRASCALPEGDFALKEGDVVRYRPAPPVAAVVVPRATVSGDEPSRSPGARSTLRDAGLRGRIGVRYLGVFDRSDFGRDLSQPAVDLWMIGRRIGGSPMDLDVDVRARRSTYGQPVGGVDSSSRTRVYRLNTAVHLGDVRIAVGRQFSTALANVSIFDGLLGEVRRARWAAGGFVGTEPDPADWSYSSDVRQAGGYIEFGSGPAASRRWAVTTGLIGSYQESEINREFVYLQGRYLGPRLSGYLAQEVDVNRDWRKEAENSSLTRTSTFASVRYAAGRGVTLDAGYDDRRNVRLYRDLITPVTSFDDAYRQGTWAGVRWLSRGHLLLGARARRSQGGTAGEADLYTAEIGVLNLTRVGLDARWRTTRYENPLLDGLLNALQVAVNLGAQTRLDVHGGVRDETSLSGADQDRTVNWFGLGIDAALTRQLYAFLSLDRTRGGNEDNDQVYASLSWRF